MVELAVEGAAQVAAAAGSGEGDVVAVLAHNLDVVVEVAGEHGVVATGEHRLHLRPVAAGAAGVVPQRLVHDDDGPARIGHLGQRLFDERELIGLGPGAGHGRVGLAHHAEKLRIQHEEQHVLVDEPVVGGSETRLPGFRHGGVAHVVVAGGVEERHFELIDEALDLVPLAVKLRLVLGVALDQVSDANHEGGFEEVDLRHRGGENAGSSAARAVADDDEVELVIRVVGVEARPGHRALGGLDVDLSDGLVAAAKQQVGGDKGQRPSQSGIHGNLRGAKARGVYMQRVPRSLQCRGLLVRPRVGKKRASSC